MALANELAATTVTCTRSDLPFIEISAAGVDKGSTLAAYCGSLGIAAANVVAFGDMPNDIPMLTWAGRGVAVANADPLVLASADMVTLANNADGVASMLTTLLA